MCQTHLETPDCLVTAILGHLLLKILLCASTVLLLFLLGRILGLLGLVFGILVDIGVRLLLKRVGGGIGSALGITCQSASSAILRHRSPMGGSILGVFLGIAFVEPLGLSLQSILVNLGGFMPGVVLCGSVNLVEIFLGGFDTGSGVGCGVSRHVAEEDGGILDYSMLASRGVGYRVWDVRTKLAKLAVGDDQGSKGPQPLEGLVSMLLCCFLVDRRTGNTDSLGVKLLGLPNEVLEQISVVLGQEKVFRLFHNLSCRGY